ncbi:MAG: PQQ-binding-like beta-propeller repeat protein [bacterium]|nr:PQQ-binding-like beta-propeller repeat protein [bacterium]
MRVKRVFEATFVAVVLAAVSGAVAGGSGSTDWPQFRGIHRDGVSAETGLSRSWSESGPKEVWRKKLGPGFSAISVVGKRAYTMYAAEQDGESTQFAAALDAGTGKEIWRTAIGKNLDRNFGGGPRSTPTVDGETVYVLGAHGALVALATKDGSEKWRVSLTETFGSTEPYFGFSTSALIDGDLLFLEAGGTEGRAYIAFDKASGKVRWSLGDTPESGPAYSSPIQVGSGKNRQYIAILDDTIRAVDSSGNEIWSHAWPSPGETHGSPIFIEPNLVFGAGAEGIGAKLLKLTKNGKKTLAEEVWSSRFMRNHFSSSIYHEGHFYGFDNATLRCISAETGEPTWAKRGLGKGSLILADGHLLVLSDKGALVLVEATAKEYREKGRVQALPGGRAWTAPALAGGKVYLRDHEEMVVYDLTR